MLDKSKTAVLFPGQGSQVPGMREQVAAVRPDLLHSAIELIGEDPFDKVELSTRYAQPAIFCASLAGWTRLKDQVDPTALAGHSLGELSALAAANAIDELEALHLVVERGRLMAESGEVDGGGTMIALLGATPAQAAKLAGRHQVSVANDNAPGQVVLSGQVDQLKVALKAAREDGIRVLELDVAGAFHSPMMQAAVEPFAQLLAQATFTTPRIDVISCATAQPFEDPATELAKALITPVRWRETMNALAARHITEFIDAGPGQILAKLVRRCVPGAGAATAKTLLEDVHAAA